MTFRFRQLLLICSTTSALLVLPAVASAADVNKDGIPDRWEKRNNLSLNVNQAKRDQDRDGLNNLYEYKSGTKPRDADTDNDGKGDASEDADSDKLLNVQEQKSLTSPTRVDSDGDGTTDVNDNQDADGLENGEEFITNTNPRSADSDSDGVSDSAEDNDGDGVSNGDECSLGDDPNDSDSDDDGTPDGNEKHGTVTSFDGTTLVATLADGTTLTANLAVGAEVKADDAEKRGHHAASSSTAALVPGAVIKKIKLDGAGDITDIELASGSDFGETEDNESEDD